MAEYIDNGSLYRYTNIVRILIIRKQTNRRCYEKIISLYVNGESGNGT